MRIRATLSAFALVGIVAANAEAQQKPMEFGIDAQAAFGLDDQGSNFAIPAQKIRAGFQISPVMSIEPSLGFNRGSFAGSSSSQTSIDVSLLYHFSADRAVNQWYVRPVIGLQRISFGGELEGSNTDMNIGVAGGLKIPLLNQVGARVEAEFRNYMSDPSVSALNLNFGLSYFTR